MTTVLRNVQPEDVRQSAKHVLFVEGKDDSALDPQVLGSLLPMVQVKAIGASYHIRSAAEALCKHHPTYYFLIDRDHHDDRFVNDCWDRFPDPSKSNLLVWPRRELENYFLIPEYLERSACLKGASEKSRDCVRKHSQARLYKVTPEKLRDCIRKHSQARLYLDVANQVIVSFREELKANWIEQFTNASDFGSANKALGRLRGLSAFAEKRENTSNILSPESIEARFKATLKDFTGGKHKLEYGCGHWLERIQGKKVLNSVVNECFSVQDLHGTALEGRELLKEVARDLLSKDLSVQPDDFQKLHALIKKRVSPA